jgi:hypothetical protein
MKDLQKFKDESAEVNVSYDNKKILKFFDNFIYYPDLFQEAF